MAVKMSQLKLKKTMCEACQRQGWRFSRETCFQIWDYPAIHKKNPEGGRGETFPSTEAWRTNSRVGGQTIIEGAEDILSESFLSHLQVLNHHEWLILLYLRE